MNPSVPPQVVVHFPGTEEGRQELARRVSEVHAGFVTDTLNRLNYPAKQKLELLQAVMDTVKDRAPETPGAPGTGKTA